jgi:hypothetical protein
MKRYKIAQMAPPPPAAGAMGAAPPMDPMMGGMDPMMGAMGGMDPMMGGMGGPPTLPTAMPGATGVNREEIGSPLDKLGKILYDVDINSLLLTQLGDDVEDTALSVWTLYGGDDKGVGVVEGRTGKRIERKNVSKEDEESEQKRTDDKRWERLPAGMSIDDITSLDKMVNQIRGIASSAVKNELKAQGAAAGGGMPMAHRNRDIVKIARKLDLIGFYHLADTLSSKLTKI